MEGAIRLLVGTVLLLALAPVQQAFSFTFSGYEAEDKGGTGQPPHRLADLRCPPSITNGKIATMIGERHRDKRHVYRGYWSGLYISEESVYGRLIDKLNHAFKQLGLAAYSDEEINAQIAREEQEAFLNNDLEAAMSAAERLQADYLLKGVISTHRQANRVVKVDEVFVFIDLALYSSDGTLLSNARVKEATFSDAHVGATVQDIVSEQAERITYELFAEHCMGGT